MFLILDDHPLAREGLASIIQMYKPMESIVQAGCVDEAMEHMKNEKVDMAFVDVNLGKENGFTFVDWLKRKCFKPKVFFITSSSRESDFDHAKELGADAYMLKDAFIDDIMYGLKVVERGGKFYSSALLERMNRTSRDEQCLHELTARELDVLVLLSMGYSNCKIGETLYISEGTTKKHITSILSKLGLENRMEALVFASRNSYIMRTAITRDATMDRRSGSA